MRPFCLLPAAPLSAFADSFLPSGGLELMTRGVSVHHSSFQGSSGPSQTPFPCKHLLEDPSVYISSPILGFPCWPISGWGAGVHTRLPPGVPGRIPAAGHFGSPDCCCGHCQDCLSLSRVYWGKLSLPLYPQHVFSWITWDGACPPCSPRSFSVVCPPSEIHAYPHRITWNGSTRESAKHSTVTHSANEPLFLHTRSLTVVRSPVPRPVLVCLPVSPGSDRN